MSHKAVNLLLVLLVTAVIVVLIQSGVEGLSRSERLSAISAVVEVVPMNRDSSGRYTPVGISGSGTVIDPRGYILTNFHVVGDKSTGKAYKYFAVLFTRTPDEEPEPRYLSTFVNGNPAKDLAIIKCTQDTTGRQVGSSLSLPTIPLGESDSLIPGDTLLILGYPGVSGHTITFTEGKMSGWMGEQGGAGKDWIKTDAKVAHGNSGGATLDENGKLVAVPTVIYKKSGESQNLLRPLKLAEPLISRMTTGAEVTALPDTPPSRTPSDVTSQLTMYIISADTSRPLAGAVAVILKGKAHSSDTLESLLDRDGMAWGESDTRGAVRFEPIKGRSVTMNGSYYLMTSAKGYQPFVTFFRLSRHEIGTVKLRAR